VAAAPANRDAPDKRSAARAGPAGPLVDSQARQEISGPSLDVDVIPKAGSLELNGSAEHTLDSTEQPPSARAGKFPSSRLRMNSGAEERLVGIDIA
jgi:hypothetical protein